MVEASPIGIEALPVKVFEASGVVPKPGMAVTSGWGGLEAKG
jgi:hypothetical protein